MVAKILNWGLFGGNGTSLNGGGTVDTGGVAVSLGFQAQDHGATAKTSTALQYRDASDPFASNSALELFGAGGEGGWDNTSTTTLTFSSTNPMFAD